MVCGSVSGSKRGTWKAWCRGILDIGRPPKDGDIVRHGTRKEAIVG